MAGVGLVHLGDRLHNVPLLATGGVNIRVEAVRCACVRASVRDCVCVCECVRACVCAWCMCVCVCVCVCV